MTAARCQWCGRPAAERCRASGAGTPIEILFCAPDGDCWERTYRTVRRYPERTWTGVERPRRRQQAGPDLFDLLPD